MDHQPPPAYTDQQHRGSRHSNSNDRSYHPPQSHSSYQRKRPNAAPSLPSRNPAKQAVTAAAAFLNPPPRSTALATTVIVDRTMVCPQALRIYVTPSCRDGRDAEDVCARVMLNGEQLRKRRRLEETKRLFLTAADASITTTTTNTTPEEAETLEDTMVEPTPDVTMCAWPNTTLGDIGTLVVQQCWDKIRHSYEQTKQAAHREKEVTTTAAAASQHDGGEAPCSESAASSSSSPPTALVQHEQAPHPRKYPKSLSLALFAGYFTSHGIVAVRKVGSIPFVLGTSTMTTEAGQDTINDEGPTNTTTVTDNHHNSNDGEEGMSALVPRREKDGFRSALASVLIRSGTPLFAFAEAMHW